MDSPQLTGTGLGQVAEFSSQIINIVLAADTAFLPYTAATLASVLRHYAGSKPLRVFLLLNEQMSAVDRQRFEALGSITSYRLEPRVVDARVFSDIRSTEGLTLATFYRLFMHELLPADVAKALYLDSDLIVRRSIDILFDMPLNGSLFGGVEDSLSLDLKQRFGIPTGGRHINAGVMLADIEMMRRLDVSRLIQDYLAVNRYRITLGDQQIIGELFHDRITYLPVTWNVHGSLFDPKWRKASLGVFNSMDADDVAAAVAGPAIIHYTFTGKPWLSLKHPMALLWYDYLGLTGYQDEVERPQAPPDPSRGQLDRAEMPSPTVGMVRPHRLMRHLLRLFDHRRSGGQRADAPAAQTRTLPAAKPKPRTHHLAITLKQILTDRANGAPVRFNAREAFEALPDKARVMSNAVRRDVDGGFAENIKTAMRTPYVGYWPSPSCDAVAVFSQRLQQAAFWDCIETAYLYDKPLFFIDVAAFACFAPATDKRATLDERRALGFQIDDLGFAFDSRQASRLERMLNDPHYALTERQTARARRLIARIVSGRFTCYNKRMPGDATPFNATPGHVVVIGQPARDVLIEFAAAAPRDGEQMVKVACAENPERQVYVTQPFEGTLETRTVASRSRVRNLEVIAEDIRIVDLLDGCSAVYTLSSTSGFEALMRGKRVVTFGQPFYAGWGLTDDRNPVRRRTERRTVEELFHVACIELSVYVNPKTGKLVEIEDALDIIDEMRERLLPRL
ncbi:hypothetical protein J5J10_09095 [Ciceribacter sp. L1K23]|uniref:glycosyltransferase n=1 Tax=Ciceribacter sp. L1K23 TaxID=2820276 RepID=UPI001B84475A|nr:glycosyltransferase [Ciceribacter sp. L1K23]MBR0555834.1 hypothetical protein [Ciceribacter sp. L1K23]